jgi:hypothetical protein
VRETWDFPSDERCPIILLRMLMSDPGKAVRWRTDKPGKRGEQAISVSKNAVRPHLAIRMTTGEAGSVHIREGFRSSIRKLRKRPPEAR